MKTKKMLAILVLVLVMGFVGSAIAGWITSGNHMHSDVSGKVGIGTNNPRFKLEVIASSSDSESEWSTAVYGRNNGAGDGVYGWSQSRHGVYGVTKSGAIEHAGVYGWNQGKGNITNYGGYFRADGDTGAGVCGWGKAMTFMPQALGQIMVPRLPSAGRATFDLSMLRWIRFFVCVASILPGTRNMVESTMWG
jgi:hypothetical protein